MKKLYFLLVSLLMATSVFSQAASSLSVVNQTNCTQYFMVIGSDACGCTPTLVSTVIAIPPAGTINYPNSTTIPGFPADIRFILGARILNGPTACNPLWSIVGSTLCGASAGYTFMALLQNPATGQCQNCATSRAAWYPAATCAGNAQLEFTP